MKTNTGKWRQRISWVEGIKFGENIYKIVNDTTALDALGIAAAMDFAALVDGPGGPGKGWFSGWDKERVVSLRAQLAEARDQVRALSSKENAEADLLKRQQSTIDALEAQIASDGSSGQIGDAERWKHLQECALSDSCTETGRSFVVDPDGLRIFLEQV